MGCACCSLSSFISVALNAFERATMCTVCAVMTFCLLFTILAVLAIGVGIGFHYCFVSTTVEEMSKAAQLTAGSEDGSGRRSNVMQALKQGLSGGFYRRARGRRDVRDSAPLHNETVTLATTFALTLNEEYLLFNNLSLMT